ncbi:MAG: class I SAM-dependent methyltransferase, partial [Burkholderiaceae bacterium]|nr:class I SAM-dependent methyltransferase [Burkholderiaceae bacterium]
RTSLHVIALDAVFTPDETPRAHAQLLAPLDEQAKRRVRGETIYGDNFGAADISAWYADEVNGYASLGHQDSNSDVYVYHAMDAAYFWRYLQGTKLDAMGLGSAYGSEFKPIAHRISGLTIVEPSHKFWRNNVAGVPARYVEPDPSGRLAFDSDRFDLVTALGVLHHIPNVSLVLTELLRVLKPGGLLALREPITSMGDWRRQRPGLTARERGLPWHLVEPIVQRAGSSVVDARMIGFAPLVKLASRRPGTTPWNNRLFVGVDALLSRCSAFNYSYHRTSVLRRFAPTVGVWLFRKA